MKVVFESRIGEDGYVVSIVMMEINSWTCMMWELVQFESEDRISRAGLKY